MLPKLNRKRALFVLTKIDEILAWERRSETNFTLVVTEGTTGNNTGTKAGWHLPDAPKVNLFATPDRDLTPLLHKRFTCATRVFAMVVPAGPLGPSRIEFIGSRSGQISTGQSEH